MFTPFVTIPNPDDPRDMPIYEGDPLKAAARLVPGVYHGTADYTELTGESDPSIESIPGTLTITESVGGVGVTWVDESGADYGNIYA